MMIAGTPTQMAVHLPEMAAERLLGDISHTPFLEHLPGKERACPATALRGGRIGVAPPQQSPSGIVTSLCA
jgi:hypothetical protein